MGAGSLELDLYKLEIFYWVAELKSFSQAADRLQIKQPTVSAHIQELERSLKGNLFYRVRGEVILTALGEVLFERAKNLLALKRETIAAIEMFHGTPAGDLWIGGSNIPGEYMLPRRLGAFVRKYPNVKPLLKIGDSAEIIEAVLDGRVELGYVGMRVNDSRLRSERIWRDEMVLAVSSAHPWSRKRNVGIEDLLTEGFISRESGSGTLESFRNLLAQQGGIPEPTVRVVMQLGSTEAVKEALIAGLGISIVSRISIRREVSTGLLIEVPIRGLKLDRDFYEIYHHRRPLSAACQSFRDFLRTECI